MKKSMKDYSTSGILTSKRTGCVGCPYNLHVLADQEKTKSFDPQLAKAAEYVFKDAYEYTRAYREFRAELKQKEKAEKEVALCTGPGKTIGTI